MNEKELERIRKLYPQNTLIKLIKMDDIQSPPYGEFGKVDFVDDAGQIHMHWENGSSLALIEGEDEFEIVKEKDKYVSGTIEAQYDNYLSVEEEVDEVEREERDI